jgi:pseudouridine-5'-phosphate glycosidase
LTPFLLKEIVKKTDGRSLEANKALALNNVRLGVKIVHQLG